MVAQRAHVARCARARANGAGSHFQAILLESYSCRGRVAQLGEHLLCKHAAPLHPFYPVL